MAFDRNEAADVAFGHRPVLLDECMEGLAIRPGGIYLDGTLGRAGHSWEIVRRLNAGGRLIGLDRDKTALEAARQRLAPYADRVTLVHSNFSRVAEVLDELGIPAVDGMLFDLGVSSPQLDDAQRGFSYMHDAPWTCAWTAPPALPPAPWSTNGPMRSCGGSCMNTARSATPPPLPGALSPPGRKLPSKPPASWWT